MSSLEEQLHNARHEVVTDGYEMSIGELVSLYKNGEIFIHPAFQRLFRWDEGRKTSFLESLLLGIPIPPVVCFPARGWRLGTHRWAPAYIDNSGIYGGTTRL